MSIRKREGSPHYWYDFTVGGVRFRGSTETDNKEAAKAIEAKLRNDVALNRHLEKKPRITLNNALGKYWLDHGQYCASANSAIKTHSLHIQNHFGKSIYLDELNDALINRYVVGQKVSNSTKNRRLELLRALINRAKDQWGVETPDLNLRKHMLKEPEARTRWITPEQADNLIECAAEHLKAPIRCALLTGLRLSNITELRWEQVDMHSRLIHVKVKSNKPGRKSHTIPMSNQLFMLMVEQQPQKEGHVFLRHFKSKPSVPVKKFRRSFQTACEKAGIEDFRFHDLRHTAASWMIQNGVPLEVVKEVLGHSEIGMTMKYAHHEDAAKKQALDSLSKAQIRHNGKNAKEASHANLLK